MKKATPFIISISVCIILTVVNALTFVDNSQSDFNGTYNNTEYNGSALILSAGNLSGTYTSQVFDANSPSTWNNINWSENIILTFDTYLTSAIHESINRTEVFTKDES